MTPNKRNWSLYNKSQLEELSFVVDLIRELVDSLDVGEAARRTGRPSADFKDMLKCVLLKEYMGLSNRRIIGWIELLHEKLGLVGETPHFNTVCNYTSDGRVKEYLKEIIRRSNLPVERFDTILSTDSSGFQTMTTSLWQTVRHFKAVKRKDFIKLHITTRVKTNVVAFATVTDCKGGDSPELRKHAAQAKQQGTIVTEWLGDTAYASRQNCTLVHELGATPFFKPRKDVKSKAFGSSAWRNMIWLWKKQPELFKKHYHKRSNNETNNYCIKQKTGAFVRTKNIIGQTVELLGKVAIHNFQQLARCYFELNTSLAVLNC